MFSTVVLSLASEASLVVVIILGPVLVALESSTSTKVWLVIAIPEVALMHVAKVFTGETATVLATGVVIPHHFTTKVSHHLSCSILWVVTTHHFARAIHHHG